MYDKIHYKLKKKKEKKNYCAKNTKLYKKKKKKLPVVFISFYFNFHWLILL